MPKHLLPRLHGYELLMAPYAIAHLKIGLKLYETGYRFGSDERARIYLTNALEPPSDSTTQMSFRDFMPALAHEAQALETAGAELLVLCTNTMHKVAGAIELAITIPFIHIADTTAQAVRGDGLDRVG
ncbi:MAG: aspartate/glutamate racemase family protein, partial [Burkholderiales bacterium]